MSRISMRLFLAAGHMGDFLLGMGLEDLEHTAAGSSTT